MSGLNTTVETRHHFVGAGARAAGTRLVAEVEVLPFTPLDIAHAEACRACEPAHGLLQRSWIEDGPEWV